jgi:hypothetical protein
MGANPLNYIDKKGGEISWAGQTLLGAAVGFIAGTVVGLISHNKPLSNGAIGAIMGAGIGLATWIGNNDVQFDPATGYYSGQSKWLTIVSNSLLNANAVIVLKALSKGRINDTRDIANAALISAGASLLGSYLEDIDPRLGYIGPTLYGFFDRYVFASHHVGEFGITKKRILGHAALGAIDGITSSFTTQFLIKLAGSSKNDRLNLLDAFPANSLFAYGLTTGRAVGPIFLTATGYFVGVLGIGSIDESLWNAVGGVTAAGAVSLGWMYYRQNAYIIHYWRFR